MTPKRILVAAIPAVAMLAIALTFPGIERRLSAFGATDQAKLMLGRIGLALPYALAGACGVIFLFGTKGSINIKASGWSVATGGLAVVVVAALREGSRLLAFADQMPAGRTLLSYTDPSTIAGSAGTLVAVFFALRVVRMGNAAFSRSEPRRIQGKRTLHGEADWMTMQESEKLFPETGGIVIGERYRVDRDDPAATSFRAGEPTTWGRGGSAPLLCFDGSFGSSHGIVFAGSGGFKTTSVTIPTALKWGGSLIVLDPSNEVAPMVMEHRLKAGRRVIVLDPKNAGSGFNALDWIGRHGGTKEEDIAAVASWIMSDSGRATGVRDDFFRASGLQLLTAMIADVCLSRHTDAKHQTLRQVRANLSEPEPKLRARLQEIYDNSASDFVKENVAAFVNMTPETFSGVYANAIKETHWLSYANYGALVSGSSFSTEALADGETDVFINIDLKTLETQAGLARVIIGAFLNAIYNRDGAIKGRALFLLDEVARLGYMRVLEYGT